jgi:pyruvate/2-oxoglutarate dehydrogenase complex dihydrolipoamide dehydrogenase (E3) component
MNRSFDAIIIGAGQAGPSLAGRLTATGIRVALIERKLVGGNCVNTGCMQTKAMVASAYAAHLVRRADEYSSGSKAMPQGGTTFQGSDQARSGRSTYGIVPRCSIGDAAFRF